VVERRNSTVVGARYSILKAKGLPNWLWGEAVQTAIYVLNRAPTKGLEGATPFEIWYGKKPSMHHLRTFGCIAYVKNSKPHLSKLEDRGHKMIFVGYENGTKAYRVYDPVTQKVHIIRDVVFDEAAQWDWGKEGAAVVKSGDFSVEYMVCSTRAPMEQEGADAGQWQIQSPVGATEQIDLVIDAHEQIDPIIDAQENVDADEQVNPESEVQLDVDHDDAPLRVRSIGSIVGQTSVPGLAIRNL
jgi:hypothetical protein